MTIEEIIEKLKAEETPDTILLVADNSIAQKLVVAWKTVEITRPDTPQDFTSMKEVWAAVPATSIKNVLSKPMSNNSIPKAMSRTKNNFLLHFMMKYGNLRRTTKLFTLMAVISVENV